MEDTGNKKIVFLSGRTFCMCLRPRRKVREHQMEEMTGMESDGP